MESQNTGTPEKKSSSKRTKLAEGFDLVHDEEEDVILEKVDQTVQKYLDNLFVLFLAYVIVGSKKIDGAPATETRLTEPTTVVEIPLETMIKVHHRATVQVRRVKPSQQLQWLETRVDAERQQWIDEFRYSEKTFGQVVAATYSAREAIWQVDEGLQRTKGDRLDQESGLTRDKSGSKRNTRKTEGASPKQSFNVGQALRTAKTLRDGAKFCVNFQKDSCRKGEKCPEGRHFCAGMQQSDRVCGGRHPACRCSNPKVKKKGS